jgi:hypothetical protein
VEFVNKTYQSLPLRLKVTSPSSASVVLPEGENIVLGPETLVKRMCFVRIPADRVTESRIVVILGVYTQDELLEEVKIKFIGPVKKSAK